MTPHVHSMASSNTTSTSTTSHGINTNNKNNNNNNNNNNNTTAAVELEDRSCRHCKSVGSLRIDWAQGDCVCTSCGVVDDERLLDDRPEWKDFGEAEDLVKGLPSGARCGLVAVDEDKYHGGLQPTSLSKRPFGTTLVVGSMAMRKSLNATNRKMDVMIVKEHKRALKRAKLSRLIQKKHKNSTGNTTTTTHHEVHDNDDNDDNVAPEHDAIVLQEEEEADRLHAALHAEKWSLDRALLLHDNNHTNTDGTDGTYGTNEARDELLSRLDAPLKRAASDLYMAYSILSRAARQLDLSMVIARDATQTLCHYAKQKDGLSVKGVSSRLSTSSTTTSINKEAAEKLREYNKQKQMAALAGALLFLEARKHGHARLLQEVCASLTNNNDTTTPSLSIELKAKHCGKAMNELRTMFPEYMRTVSMVPPSLPNNNGDTATTNHHETNSSNFVEHATRKLKLPPVATVCIQSLVTLELAASNNSTPKLSTVCASMTLFITMVGTIMQRLAQQAAPYQTATTTSTASPSSSPSSTPLVKEENKKKRSFDLFAHPAVEHQTTTTTTTYEMRQVWDAWLEQMSWNRSIADIVQSFGTSSSKMVVLDHYKRYVYPQRVELLSKLATMTVTTPRATVLLSQVSCTAALLNSNGGSV